MVDVAVQKQRKRGNVLKTHEIGCGAYDAGEHEELIEFIVTDRKRVAPSFCCSIRMSLAFFHQRIRMLRTQLGLLHLPQKLKKSIAVRVIWRQALAHSKLEAIQGQVLLLVNFVKL